MVSFVVDRYSENWQELEYVLADGRAEILVEGEEFSAALGLLRQKYPQYRSMRLENRPIIKIAPLRVIAWTGASGSPSDCRTVKPKA